MAALRVSGAVQLPGDKSLSHRALILSALASGKSCIRDVLQAADVASTAGALRVMGVAIPELGSSTTVPGRGLRGLTVPPTVLDCGNSGTTARLMAGVVAGHPFAATLTGDDSLRRRPMGRVARPLTAMGARIELDAGDRLPMTVHGADLRSVRWTSPTATAQVKSAVLLAALCAQVPVTVNEPVRSRDHTERMLLALGADLTVDGTTVRLGGNLSLDPLDTTIPRDPSSAAFMAGLAALAESGELMLAGVCVNPTRIGFVSVLQRMGARITLRDEQVAAGEPVADLIVAPGELRGVTIGAAEIPSLVDEVPLIACVAARAQGETTISGASELRVKESNRIAAVVTNLRMLGAEAEETADGLCVTGSTRALRGRVTTHGDHRIAMAFAVLGTAVGCDIEVDDPACVDVSYPRFWRDLAAVTTATAGDRP